MSDWEDLFEAQDAHDNIHSRYPNATSYTCQSQVPDPSCLTCFPDFQSPDHTWRRFCQWFSLWYSVQSHTGHTRQYWRLLCTSTLPATDPFYSNTFRCLILTFRYNQTPSSVEQIVQTCCDTFVRTR